MKEQVYCVIDYETRSKANLKETGSYEYANHKSTRVLCVAWRIGTKKTLREAKTEVWTPISGIMEGDYGSLKKALLDPTVKLVAHNALFEQVTTRYVLTKEIFNPELKEIPIERWICTASMARALALPGKLEGACSALELSVQKDMEGHRLMLKLSKPRKPTKNNPAVWHKKKSDLRRLMEYCKTDIDAEVELFLSLPELNPFERKIWELDQKMNLRGFRCDRPFVKKVLGMISEESERFERLTQEITGGEVQSTAQRDVTLKWLAKEDCFLENLQKKTVSDALVARMGSPKALRLLEVRSNASKTSTAKYEAFESRSRTDGRVRDNLIYHTASTGRWGGAGVQPQNFPQGTLSNPEQAIDIILDESTDLELVRMLYGNPLDVFSSCLRGAIQASEGRKFNSGDFAGIEVRVLFWMAKHEEGLQAFRDGRDLYREIAAIIFGVKVDAVTKAQREVGKRVILGCGFGMGPPKFFETCKTFGQEISELLSETAVKTYRRVHHPVKKFWSNLEKAAIAAVMNRGKRYSINRTSWWVQDEFLYCQLPSGRRLAYYGPEIRYKATPWGEKKATLYHYDVHPKTKKWVLSGTYGGRLTENVVQATARDFMAEAMPRVEDSGYELLITVHDELLAESDKDKGSEAEFQKLMSVVPPWGAGCPIKVEGWSATRYKK